MLQVARQNDIFIPGLCYHQKLGGAGLCRICVIEVEGIPGLKTACTLEALEGMQVHTSTDQVLAARRIFVEMLLASGAHDCLSCETSGDCELREAAEHLGIKKSRFNAERQLAPIDDSSPFIIRDPNKCIRCSRCIRGCKEVVVNSVLEMGHRGDRCAVKCDADRTLRESSCVSCGECVQLCPTGALTEKKALGKGRSEQIERVRTTCPYCGVGCQMELHVDQEANRILRVNGVQGTPPNDGMLCVKGRFGTEFPSSPERLTAPLIRKDGRLEAVSWEEALDFTASRLSEIQERHGPDALAMICCARSTNESNYAAMKFARAALGTNNVDHCART